MCKDCLRVLNIIRNKKLRFNRATALYALRREELTMSYELIVKWTKKGDVYPNTRDCTYTYNLPISGPMPENALLRRVIELDIFNQRPRHTEDEYTLHMRGQRVVELKEEQDCDLLGEDQILVALNRKVIEEQAALCQRNEDSRQAKKIREQEYEQEKIKEEERNKKREEKEKIEAEKRKQNEKLMMDWINQNGSSRLQKQLKVGLDGWPLYLHERLAIEFPGFELDRDGNDKEHKNPTEAQLDELFLAMDRAKELNLTSIEGEIKKIEFKDESEHEDDDEGAIKVYVVLFDYAIPGVDSIYRIRKEV